MSDLTDFLLARIAEDEEAALVESLPPGSHSSHGSDEWGTVNLACPACRALTLNAWARPRVLAECEAKRRVVETNVTAFAALGDPDDDVLMEGARRMYWHTLRALAAVHSDHPDYRPEWRP